MTKQEENQASAISRFFSSTIIQEMARRGRSPLLAKLIRESQFVETFPKPQILWQIFEEAFSFLKRKNFRHEYIYKTALTQKLLLGVHNLRTASMLSEFRVGNCKADYAILNGTATVYEIKSERDTLFRLERQIEAYMKVFATVNVIAGENHIESVLKLVPREVGVFILSNRYQLSPLRKGKNIPKRTSPAAIFESIRLREAKIILEDLGMQPRKVPNTELYEELRSHFIKLKPYDAQIGMVRTLKETRNLVSLKYLIDGLPPSLQAAILSTSLRKQDYARLLQAINTSTKAVIRWA